MTRETSESLTASEQKNALVTVRRRRVDAMTTITSRLAQTDTNMMHA